MLLFFSWVFCGALFGDKGDPRLPRGEPPERMVENERLREEEFDVDEMEPERILRDKMAPNLASGGFALDLRGLLGESESEESVEDGDVEELG